jgi:hypothetical protein
MEKNEMTRDSEVSHSENTISQSKRTLMKAAWIPPVVMAVSLPRSGYAANMSGASASAPNLNNPGNHFGNFK